MQNYINELNDIISVGDKIEELVTSELWDEIIEPIFEKLVRDSVGGKLDGQYICASEQLKTMSEGELKFNLGFVEGVMKPHQLIMQFIKDRDEALIRLDDIKNEPDPRKWSGSSYDLTEDNEEDKEG